MTITNKTKLAATVLVLAGLAIAIPSALQASKDAATLQGGMTSKEEVIRRFVAALSAGDGHALRTLQVTETEYRDIILPGAVPVGQPMRQWPEDVRGYFTREFIQKSQMVGANLLENYKGHQYQIESVTFERGTKRYSNHFAYVQLRLKLRDETGADHELATGSIVEIGGQYKFMSYLPG